MIFVMLLGTDRPDLLALVDKKAIPIFVYILVA